MEKMADKLASCLYRKGEAMSMSYEAFRYAVQFALEMAAGLFASAAIGIALGMVKETAIFLAVFWSLRSYAGGIHLSRFSCCFVFSAFIIAGTVAVVKYVSAPLWVSHLMAWGGGAAFLMTEPESDRNRKVDEEEEACFRRRLKRIIMAIALSYAWFAAWGRAAEVFTIALTVDVVYGMMILGKIKNRRAAFQARRTDSC